LKDISIQQYPPRGGFCPEFVGCLLWQRRKELIVEGAGAILSLDAERMEKAAYAIGDFVTANNAICTREFIQNMLDIMKTIADVHGVVTKGAAQ
jgi:hypothetical protein